MEELISKTPETRALQLLDEYVGSNNYILNLKHKKQAKSKILMILDIISSNLHY